MNTKLSFWVTLSAIVMLILALTDMPGEYYKFLRFVVVAAAIFSILEIRSSNISEGKKVAGMLLFGVIGIIFNPLLPLEMNRAEWIPFDLMGAILFCGWRLYRLENIRSLYSKMNFWAVFLWVSILLFFIGIFSGIMGLFFSGMIMFLVMCVLSRLKSRSADDLDYSPKLSKRQSNDEAELRKGNESVWRAVEELRKSPTPESQSAPEKTE